MITNTLFILLLAAACLGHCTAATQYPFALRPATKWTCNIPDAQLGKLFRSSPMRWDGQQVLLLTKIDLLTPEDQNNFVPDHIWKQMPYRFPAVNGTARSCKFFAAAANGEDMVSLHIAASGWNRKTMQFSKPCGTVYKDMVPWCKAASDFFNRPSFACKQLNSSTYNPITDLCENPGWLPNFQFCSITNPQACNSRRCWSQRSQSKDGKGVCVPRTCSACPSSSGVCIHTVRGGRSYDPEEPQLLVDDVPNGAPIEFPTPVCFSTPTTTPCSVTKLGQGHNCLCRLRPAAEALRCAPGLTCIPYDIPLSGPSFAQVPVEGICMPAVKLTQKCTGNIPSPPKLDCCANELVKAAKSAAGYKYPDRVLDGWEKPYGGEPSAAACEGGVCTDFKNGNICTRQCVSNADCSKLVTTVGGKKMTWVCKSTSAVVKLGFFDSYIDHAQSPVSPKVCVPP